MDNTLVDPAEAVAHLIAHDLRAPLFLAAELLTATSGELGDAVDEAIASRLEVVVQGLREACDVADSIVGALRTPPDAPDDPDPDGSIVALVAELWPDADRDVAEPAAAERPGLAVLRAVLRDLAQVAPTARTVRVAPSERWSCRIETDRFALTTPAYLALARAARRVRAGVAGQGDLRVGRCDTGLSIDARIHEGADAP